MRFSLEELKESYDVELERIVKELEAFKGKTVLIQFPDGMKPWAITIVEYLKEKSDANIRIWFGDCFGSCDVPESGADAMIAFGHAPWSYKFDGTGIERKKQKEIFDAKGLKQEIEVE